MSLFETLTKVRRKRFLLLLRFARKWLCMLGRRKISPVWVILKRLRTDLLVLSFGICVKWGADMAELKGRF